VEDVADVSGDSEIYSQTLSDQPKPCVDSEPAQSKDIEEKDGECNTFPSIGSTDQINARANRQGVMVQADDDTAFTKGTDFSADISSITATQALSPSTLISSSGTEEVAKSITSFKQGGLHGKLVGSCDAEFPDLDCDDQKAFEEEDVRTTAALSPLKKRTLDAADQDHEVFPAKTSKIVSGDGTAAKSRRTLPQADLIWIVLEAAASGGYHFGMPLGPLRVSFPASEMVTCLTFFANERKVDGQSYSSSAKAFPLAAKSQSIEKLQQWIKAGQCGSFEWTHSGWEEVLALLEIAERLGVEQLAAEITSDVQKELTKCMGLQKRGGKKNRRYEHITFAAALIKVREHTAVNFRLLPVLQKVIGDDTRDTVLGRFGKDCGEAAQFSLADDLRTQSEEH
jgi:hypothetical protein